MSLRIRIGAIVCTITNFLIGVVFTTSHEAMHRNEVWRYVVFNDWIWKGWATWFFLTALLLVIGISANNVNRVRFAVAIGVIGKALWSYGFALSAFDPSIHEATGMAQLLAGTVGAYETVFLAWRNTPRLDAVVAETAVRRERSSKRVA